MALIIKADMPKACITGKLPNYDYCLCFGICHHANSGTERPKDCPLVEIPDEHGDLIEGEKVLKVLDAVLDNKEFMRIRQTLIDAVPIVVEATT